MFAKTSWGLINIERVQFFYTNKTSEDVEIVAFFESGITKVCKRVDTEEEAQKWLTLLHNVIETKQALGSIV